MPRTKPSTHSTVSSSLACGQTRSASPRVAEDIAAHLQQLIATSQLADGERLPSERDLATIFATSRPTVSQAIRILVVQGLVESRHGSGAYVTHRPEMSLAASIDLMLNLNHESVGHLGDMRFWLETIGVVQAIDHATPELLAEAERALCDLVTEVGDTAAWIGADTKFHATLVRASANPYLASIYESTHTALINYEYQEWIDTGTVPRWIRKSQAGTIEALHAPILRAVRDKDPEAARAAVLHHHEAMSRHLAESRRPTT